MCQHLFLEGTTTLTHADTDYPGQLQQEPFGEQGRVLVYCEHVEPLPACLYCEHAMPLVKPGDVLVWPLMTLVAAASVQPALQQYGRAVVVLNFEDLVARFASANTQPVQRPQHPSRAELTECCAVRHK
jgi:hypothetical protein